MDIASTMSAQRAMDIELEDLPASPTSPTHSLTRNEATYLANMEMIDAIQEAPAYQPARPPFTSAEDSPERQRREENVTAALRCSICHDDFDTLEVPDVAVSLISCHVAGLDVSSYHSKG